MFAKGTPISSTRIIPTALPICRQSLTVVCGESRIGRSPVPIPSGVEYNFTGQHLKVKGPLGELEHVFSDDIAFSEKNGSIVITRVSNRREAKAMHGLARALCNNMFIGVSRGYEKILIMNGVGYRASVEGDVLNLNVGFCHPVLMDIPKGVKVKVEESVKIIISGFDKAVVGNFSAVIRSKRPPEPYKGKGIRYENEVIKLKDGKRGK